MFIPIDYCSDFLNIKLNKSRNVSWMRKLVKPGEMDPIVLYFLWKLWRKKRKMRARRIYVMRSIASEFVHLYPQLRQDSEKFFNYTRMSISSFDELLGFIRLRDGIFVETTTNTPSGMVEFQVQVHFGRPPSVAQQTRDAFKEYFVGPGDIPWITSLAIAKTPTSFKSSGRVDAVEATTKKEQTDTRREKGGGSGTPARLTMGDSK
ncbi:unnamed protein product [Cyprideis torosa]|uniref:Uncharacterized protein n=1 Tax=Cyprideis torosa TaxID=163714 RepID=A0A7R8WC05_9CRUS|nr:unnamed protein product [Cyprideis torosa]CAG0892669.1 unnamed protein product [Cyprideis torosa]